MYRALVIPATVALGLIAATSAFAGPFFPSLPTQVVITNQFGAHNAAVQIQKLKTRHPHGVEQFSMVNQFGHGNLAVTQQSGSDQSAVVVQVGQNNAAAVTQAGKNQTAIVTQVGNGNVGGISQVGNGQFAYIMVSN
jgi:minor curlin subunit